MQTHIQKWGNSLALRIPKSFAKDTNMEQGTLVDVTLQDGRLVVTPIEPPLTLDQLVAQITPENVHSEQEFGAAVGREVW
jgi:antitoxin MazE